MSLPPEYALKDAFIDRELSWLGFNQRVLEEALDPGNPLLERIKFLAIVANNLDEFFEVRLAALLQKVESGTPIDGIAALDAPLKLDAVLKQCQKMVKQQYRCWNEELLPRLKENGVCVKSMKDLSKEEERYIQTHFRKEIYHLLTPIKVDPAHPFPWVLNKSLCLAALLKEDSKRNREGLGVISIPRSLPRVLALPSRDKTHNFVFIHEVVQHYINELFKGYQIRSCVPFRVTRNSNLYLEDEESDSLIDAVEAVVHNRRKGDVVRLEIDKGASKRIVDLLARNFDIDQSLVFRVDGPVNLNRLMGLYNQVPLAHLKYPPLQPSHAGHFQETEDLFHEIRHRDVLLHHPFDSYDPVVRFIQSAAEDPKVQVIKQTLYRTSEDSPIMYALLEAAEQGKQVVAVVELKARFDEKSNIHWARRLEEKGGTVVYGLVGLKTHCKLSLIIRKEESGFRQYAHVGTGNYNPDTARRYTDLSLLTSDPQITDGVSEVFNHLTSQSRAPDFHSLLVGPVNMLKETLRLIHRERDHALAGRASGIVAKMNALYDREVIEALYEASQAGVPVRLIVRGICALRPGIKGLSENIQVRSVVGRYLEHSRIYHFENDGKPQVYIGSGDWMDRNLRERVEVSIPIKTPAFIRQLEDVLSAYWADNVKARIMKSDGTYVRAAATEGEEKVNAQEWLARRAEAPDLPLPAGTAAAQRPIRPRPEPAPEALLEEMAGETSRGPEAA
jgi:polyphosphate kinase